MTTWFRVVLGFAIALAGAMGASWLQIPLPWMLGPLIVTAITKVAGSPGVCLPFARNAGQWVIGTSLGLYFTHEMMRLIGSNAGLIGLGVLFALLLGCLGAWILSRFAHADFKTAWFASAVGGASEMTELAERYGARPDLVASAHGLRVMMVVVSIPFIFEWLNFSGEQVGHLARADFLHLPGLLLLAVLSAAAGALFQFLRVPNPWVLGPMVLVGTLTFNDVVLSGLPIQISSLGQLCIGWALGDKFGPDFFRRAPRYLGVAAISNLLNLVLAFGFAYGLYRLSDIAYPTLVLSVSPGGIAEMAITAKVLQLGAPLVTSFQVARMVCVLVLTGPLYTRIARWLKVP
ncbi:MAG TPA: ammonia monooxygenase [Alcaligenes faecalis]|nr:ammonia monooxygenase [Alcaligenes faecalis]